MNTQHTTSQPSAFDVLIEHCQETHPHFENPRGQADIAAAQAEHVILLEALRQVCCFNISPYETQPGKCAVTEIPEDGRKIYVNAAEALRQNIEFARAAIAHATGQEAQS